MRLETTGKVVIEGALVSIPFITQCKGKPIFRGDN